MTSGQLKILICSSLENLGKKSECGSLFEAVGVNEISQGERREAEGPPTTQPFSVYYSRTNDWVAYCE